MKERVLLERRQEARYGRFALTLGLAAAALVHLALFWVPTEKYQPFLEVAKLRREVVGKPFRGKSPPRPAPPLPRPPETAKPPPGTPAPPSPLEPAPALTPQPQPETPPALPSAGNFVASPERDQADRERAPVDSRGEGRALSSADDNSAAVASRGALAPVPQAAGAKASKEGWSDVLADLASRGKSLAERPPPVKQEVAKAAPKPARPAVKAGTAGGGSDESADEDLDPRIRITVVSYPPSSLDEDHPNIRYPDIRVQRRNMEAGICRVYYRVWIDDEGRIVRHQFRTPETKEAQRRYEPFVKAVKEAVDGWTFPRAAGEVHVDVLFEIE